MAGFEVVAEVPCEVARSFVYEHGWQSWSPSGCYPATGRAPRPRDERRRVSGYRPDRPAPTDGFQGEGLLAVVPDGAPVRVWWAPDPTREVASVRARAGDGRVVVSADGPVEESVHERAGDLDGALGHVADTIAARLGVDRPRAIPPVWCSWYCYWRDVSEADILANLETMNRLRLPVEVVQIDDGYEADIGDWLVPSPRFRSLPDLAARIRDTGRRAGIWVAPFLVGSRGAAAADHPDWLVEGALPSRGWGQELRVLDVTHPGAAEHLSGVFRRLVEYGFDYFKIDFVYAGALEGRRREQVSGIEAYRRGVQLIRDAIGPGSVLLGCGAPTLSSVGLFDAMRVSCDVAPHAEPRDGDLAAPSLRGALMGGRARAFQHGRFWVNDPDCLIVRAEVERRADWAEHVDACRGLVASSDPLDRLDGWGLKTTRRLLRASSTGPVRWDPYASAEQGRVLSG